MLRMKEGISVRLKQDHSGTKDDGSQSMEGLVGGVWVVGGDGTHWRSVWRSDGTDWNMWKNSDYPVENPVGTRVKARRLLRR